MQPKNSNIKTNVREKKKPEKPKKIKRDDGRLPQKTVRSKKSVMKERVHPEYGTSKLEEKFAKEFLDKLGVNYVYQYKAESIGRYYDFFLPDNNILLEVDGTYFHSRGLTYEEMSPMQKHNKRVDEIKDRWALEHCIPLIRIWEDDINKHPSEVMKMLKEKIVVYTNKHIIDENKKKRH